ncbi:conserved Plasmodium membrane protein, unknown function [Plasmodium gallinaceum]|uniref:Uncharacterized protein n=1 Tax=Plasmodium gallinaceum TaxID=5849 RepID=A0A1J1GS69_PLAGA|nr:conserved Plasmodium membrane protein, unknown function [Plasmodium gallinaceum]CRG95276.1 conserved Plasmodium membrane protein, unknown function [Plasmodium gallinaceum]
MINFETFLLVNNKILKSYSFFENVLTYYILRRLVKYLLVKHSKNYTIEICSCNELNVNNLFYSKNINFYKIENDKLLLNFFRIILREKKTDFKIYFNKHDICLDNHSYKWNDNILKILFFYYNQLKKKNKFKYYRNFFLSFSTYILSLLHYENNIIKKKDKILFLFLFLLFFTTNSSKKKKNRLRKPNILNKKNKNNIFFNDYQELYDILYIHFNKVKIKDIQKLLKNHLFHIYIFNENGNGEKKNEKKKVLILCKETLFYLNEICANYMKFFNMDYKISNLKINEQLLKSFCLFKSFHNKYRSLSFSKNSIMNIKKNNFCHLYVLLKYVYKNKFISIECMKKITYFLRKNIFSPLYFRKYLKLFYYKFFYNYKKLTNNCYVAKYKNMKKCQKKKRLSIIETNYIEKKKKKKCSFTIICIYICLIYNINYYNLYYYLISLLKKYKTLSFHEKISYFIDELAKIDAKCHYIWNIKNILFYFYVDMYLKENCKIIKNGKNERNTSNIFLFFLRIIISSNKYKIYKKKKKLIFTKNIIKTKIYNKKGGFKKHIIEKLYNKRNENSLLDFGYNVIYYKNRNKHKYVILKNFLEYLNKNFDSFFKILECKSHNYMAASHIFILYNFLFFFCFKKKKKIKNNFHSKLYSMKKNFYKKYKIILHKNIYYYAFHNMYLLLYIQKIYYFLIEYLNNFFFVIFKKNMYTYNLNSLIFQKSYNKHIFPNDYKFYRKNYYNCGDIYEIYNVYNNNYLHCCKFNNPYKKKNNSIVTKIGKYSSFYHNVDNINNTYSDSICNNYNYCNPKKNLNKLAICKNCMDNVNKNYFLNTTIRNKSIYIKNTYLEIYIFLRKKNYGEDINFYFLYNRIKFFLINFKTTLKDMIKFLSKYYNENYYFSFYTNALRNIFYCICNYNFFFHELFYNLIIPLLFQNSCSNKKKKKKKTVITLFRDFDCYFMKELKFLKKHYMITKIKYEKKYKHTKINNHLIRRYLNKNKSYYKCIINHKKWITNNFHIFSINKNPDIYSILISFNKIKNKKKEKQNDNFSVKQFYFIYLKCVITLIHEHSINVYHTLKKHFYTEKNILEHINNRCNNLSNHFNKINTDLKISNTYNYLNYTKHNTSKNRTVKNNISINNQDNNIINDNNKDNNVNNNEKYNKVIYYLNLKENLNFLYKIYIDIFQFFEILRKNNFIFFYILKNIAHLSKKIKKNIFFLKFFFSINFLMFLCEHTYIFYLLKEIYKILNIVFSKKFYIYN